MVARQEQPTGGSIVRDTLLLIEAAALLLARQVRSALVLGAAIGGLELLTRFRRAETEPEEERQGTPRLQRVGPPAQARRRASETRPREGGTRPMTTPKEKHQDSGPGKELKEAEGKLQRFLNQHPALKAFIEKVTKDNIGMLAAFLSWTLLVSIVPVLVGLVAISGLFLRSASARAQVVSHLSNALQGALSTREIEQLVTVSTQHAGLLGLIGFVGVLWGGSSIGGAISTAFQAIFEVQGRSFIKEKLIDIGMLFVFTILMLVIILGTTAGAIVTHLLTAFPVPGLAQAAGIAISLLAAVILFATIYLVFPNIQPRFKFGNVWRGAVVGAVLFTILSLIWPVYENFAHFGRYGTLLGPILLMAAWVYFFSMIVMIGAEVVAVGAIRGAEAQEKPVGPEPTESVPQHTVLRDRPKAS